MYMLIPLVENSCITPPSSREFTISPIIHIRINSDIWNWKLLTFLDLAVSHENIPRAITNNRSVKLLPKGSKISSFIIFRLSPVFSSCKIHQCILYQTRLTSLRKPALKSYLPEIPYFASLLCDMSHV